MGCGKTTVGKLLSKKLNMKFIDTDNYITTQTNTNISEIFEKYGEPYFRDLENELVKKSKIFVPTVLSLGGGTLINKKNISILKNTGKIIYLKASITTIKDRLKNDNTRPLLKKSSNLEILYKSRCKTYEEAADITVCADKSPYSVCIEIINNL